MHLIYETPLSHKDQWRFLRMEVAEATGWNLEYIDNLSVNDVGDWIAVRSSKAKAEQKLKRMNELKSKGKRGKK